MKIRNIISALSGILLLTGLTGCDGEKDLIIIEGNLPIKTSTLYMVGDATPNGWSIDAPTPFTATEEDPLVFTWEGPLNAGEMKLCLTTGSWDAPFIRPQNNGEAIDKNGVEDYTFDMHAGDPDNKWKVVDAGKYKLLFDLRNWKMSATYLGELDAPEIEPIVTDVLYIVGDATPNGWNIDEPTALEKTGDYTFVYEGPLNTGEMKACITTGSWDVEFIRPAQNECKINKEGVEVESFIYSVAPDNKWKVEEAAIYRITFDLENWTIKVECTGEYTPIPKLYMIGEATDGGWSLDDATVVEASADNEKIYVWEGELGRGSLKASHEKDFSAPFYRPATANCEISENGVASHDMVYTTEPDDQWLVTTAGMYRLTFNTEAMTFNAEYLEGSATLPTLYMIGDATAGGWSLDAATEITTTTENLYVWEGDLKTGTFKASFTKDFGADFYRPTTADCEVSVNGVASKEMTLSASPDDQWKVVDAGKYRLTFDIANMTFDAVCLEGGSTTTLPTLYMIGDATAGGWSLDAATEINTTTENIYVWEGELNTGALKASFTKDFNADFYRPTYADCEISVNGVASNGMTLSASPDDKWEVVDAGVYRLTFDLANMTFDAVCLEQTNPIVPLYMIGDATAGGWSLDDATQFTPNESVEGEYTWTGTLNKGSLKACSVKDFSAPFYRPTYADCEISENGVASNDMIYTTSPDDKWKVVTAGTYRLTLNIKSMTINVQYLD